jgi:hypothetical protein
MASQSGYSASLASTEHPSGSRLNRPLRRQSSSTPSESTPIGIHFDPGDLSTGNVTAKSGDGTQLVRHSDLWFDDGSVICQAESMLFKVHMSQLARHSVCFRDMFSIPQPESGQCSSTDLACNCPTDHPHRCHTIPIVQLHDTAEDVGNLLTALYDGPCVDCLFVVGGINSSLAHEVLSETTASKTSEVCLESFVYRPST